MQEEIKKGMMGHSVRNGVVITLAEALTHHYSIWGLHNNMDALGVSEILTSAFFNSQPSDTSPELETSERTFSIFAYVSTSHWPTHPHILHMEWLRSD
jgi:hypothetical protein